MAICRSICMNRTYFLRDLDVQKIADRVRSAFPQYIVELNQQDSIINIVMGDRINDNVAWLTIDLDTYHDGRVVGNWYCRPDIGAWAGRDKRVFSTAIGH